MHMMLDEKYDLILIILSKREENGKLVYSICRGKMRSTHIKLISPMKVSFLLQDGLKNKKGGDDTHSNIQVLYLIIVWRCLNGELWVVMPKAETRQDTSQQMIADFNLI